MESDDPELRDVELALPWYITGRLERMERDKVASYLFTHPGKAALAARARDEQTAAGAVNAAAQPRGSSLARIMAKARAGERFRFGSGLWARIERFFASPTSGAVKWVFAAGTLIVVGQALVIGSLVPQLMKENAQRSPPKSPEEASIALIRFAENAPFAAVTDTLASLGVTIIDGPGPGGFFKVRLGPHDMNERTRIKRIIALRRRRDTVKLVVPGFAGPRP